MNQEKDLKPGIVVLLPNRLAVSAPLIAVAAGEKVRLIKLMKADDWPIIFLGRQEPDEFFSQLGQNDHYDQIRDIRQLIATLSTLNRVLGYYWKAYAERAVSDLFILNHYLSGEEKSYPQGSDLEKTFIRFRDYIPR